MSYKSSRLMQHPLKPHVDHIEGGVVKICVSNKNGAFKGKQLYTLLTACGLNLEKSGFFTRYENGNKVGNIQFRIYNTDVYNNFGGINEPYFETSMITLIIDLAEPSDVKNSFEIMLATGMCVSKNLGGIMLNEDLSELHVPTIRKSYNLL